ncbi:MAG: DUF1592 domain-containing protein [Verrucomicrobiales bacterium]|nr:DUF1592 domain-containing protein [Verrucomicrobiales bacterium]
MKVFFLICWLCFFTGAIGVSEDSAAEKEFDEIEPILMDFCYDCHGDGMDKGDFMMDDYESVVAHLRDFDVWYETWKNVRSNLMPPADKKQPTDEERKKVLAFIESRVFEIDHENPDPGRVTIRRLNREEYRNTIKDLLQIDFNVKDILPVDDTGYGFDTIGDVLSISPLLMEKYLEAAEKVVEKAVPRDGPEIVEWWLDVDDFRDARSESWSLDWMPFEHARKMESKPWVNYDGEYEIRVDFNVIGSDEASSNSATLKVGVGDRELTSRQLGWDNSKRLMLKTKTTLKRGRDQTIWLATERGAPPEKGEKKLAINVNAVRIRGPLDGSQKDYPRHVRYLFSEGPPPPGAEERDIYREKIFRTFATRAFRRPVEEGTLERLVKIARQVDAQPGNSFEDGIAMGIKTILVSPRFLLRAEIQPEPDNPGKIVPIDEFALASRLSYFLWSSTPDDELLRLASEGRLRVDLRKQVDRMLKDEKSLRFVQNFVGQWLMARDVETMNIDERRVLNISDLNEARRTFSLRLRASMRKESEYFFAHILKENRLATELLTANYTFLNEVLADWYKVEGVKGSHMRLVKLPEDSIRGGLLSQGTFQVVTSNPTRTSPVKRGLFVLENFLATPPPPAVPDVPPLEEAAKGGKKNLTLRELLALHSEQAMCASCHQRMDPIGLALENFSPVGLWRDNDKGQPIDASGKLMTGEVFGSAKELSEILATARYRDFHRALAEKLLTYAVGRGIEYYDAPTIDKIVMDIETHGATLREIVYGVIESAPFQKRRGDGDLFATGAVSH